VQGCQTVSGSRLFVAERSHSYVCYCLFLYRLQSIWYMCMKVILLRRNVSAFYIQHLCLQRMSGVVWRIVKPTYHSSVEWLIADVTDVSTLHQLTVFHAWGIVRLTLRYTTPDMRCRERRYESDGGISKPTRFGVAVAKGCHMARGFHS